MTSNPTEPAPDENNGMTTDHESPREKSSGQEEELGGKNAATGLESQQDGDADADGTTKKAKPGFFAAFVEKTGLNAQTLLIMFKGSLPPTIGIAMYQAPAVASYFTTLGYLVPIITVIALAILPRGKYIQSLVLNLAAVCVGAAVSLLALWSSVQARIHTTVPTPGESPAASAAALYTYNSSQSAVCGIWLFANIWFANVVRAKMPSFNLPVIIYSILVNISATYGPFMTTTAAAEAFVKELLTAMLVALALATAVNLLVFPISSRLVVFGELAACTGLLRKMVGIEGRCLAALESDDMLAFAGMDVSGTDSEEESVRAPVRQQGEDEEGEGSSRRNSWADERKAVEELRDTQAKLRELTGKLHGDMSFAKRDIAWGKLDAKGLSAIFTKFRNIYIPVLGIASIMDIIKRVAVRRGWGVDSDPADEEAAAQRSRDMKVWNEIVQQMRAPFGILSQAVDQALEHASLSLELVPRPKGATKKSGSDDVEARGADIKPGDVGFAAAIKDKINAFSSSKSELLKTWTEHRGLTTGEKEQEKAGITEDAARRREYDQVHLFVILYMESLMLAAGEAAYDLAAFADEKMRDGTMSRNRLIVPTGRRLRKWVRNVFESEDTTAEQAPDMMEATTNIVHLGDAYHRRKDPEHMPPENSWQHLGNGLRKVSKLFASEESAFGFRAACATMTVAIVAYLEPTQLFFMQQRLVWAMIIIAIGMTMTSGQSFFGFLCRVGGTVIAMCSSLVVWYIVDQNVPGVIVFLWLSVFIDYYFFMKFPRFAPAIMITIVTQVLIIGYELQVLEIGQAAATRTGQPYYPIYELAPYRLACVAGGSLVAFIWTIFPSPLTDRTWLRRDLSATLYLLANYFSVINSCMQASLRDAGPETAPGKSPFHHLLKVRRKIFGKVMMLIPSMHQHAEWQRWEPTVGGRFPRKTYEEIIMRSTRIMGYLTLMGYALTNPGRERAQTGDGDNDKVNGSQDGKGEVQEAGDSENQREWLNALAAVLATLEPTHHTILSTLTLLSNSLMSGQSLPPFLPLPRPYEMTRTLLRLGQGELSSGQSRLRFFKPGDDAAARRPDAKGAPPSPPLGVTAADLLDARHMEQPGYAEFAVLQVCSTLVCDDLEGLVHAVGSLVGVVDFSQWGDERGSSAKGQSQSKGKTE